MKDQQSDVDSSAKMYKYGDMINMEHDIGRLRAEMGEKNREAIFEFLRDNPGSKQVDCAKHFGLNIMTISKHVKAIRSGWRPKVER